MNALVKLEPIQPPSERRPALIPKLPAWAVSLTAAARSEPQLVVGKDGQETFRDVMVLPAAMMPTADQLREIENHIASLRYYLFQTPENSDVAETATAMAITKVLSVLPSQRRSEIGEDIRNEAYLDVLEDVPHWAVENAIRRWHKHSCGNDERGRPHDYKWAPDPGTLRKIALEDVYAMHNRIQLIGAPMKAVEYVDCSAAIERGKLAMRGLHKAMKGESDLASLTFEKAVDLGSAPSRQPAAGEGTQRADDEQDRDQRHDDPQDFDHHGRDDQADRGEYPEHQQHADHQHA